MSTRLRFMKQSTIKDGTESSNVYKNNIKATLRPPLQIYLVNTAIGNTIIYFVCNKIYKKHFTPVTKQYFDRCAGLLLAGRITDGGALRSEASYLYTLPYKSYKTVVN